MRHTSHILRNKKVLLSFTDAEIKRVDARAHKARKPRAVWIREQVSGKSQPKIHRYRDNNQ